MKQIGNIQQHFSIRKLTVGVASVLIGLSFLGFGTQTVRADVTNTASDTAKTEQAESNQQNAATDDTTTSDDNAVKADQQKVAVKENDNSITKTADADKDFAKTVVDNKATETKNETTPATNTSAYNSAVQKTEEKSAETTPAVDNTSDANKNATETTKPATSTTPVNDTDAKTPAKEGDVGKTEPGETTKDASKPATTDQGNLLKKQQLLILIRSKMVQ